MGNPDSEARELQDIREQMLRDFLDVPQAQVEHLLAVVVAGFANAPVRVFVPLLVRRFARVDLLAARGRALTPDGPRRLP